MFFILKLVLIILLNKTNGFITHDAETTILPTWNFTDTKELPLTLKAFGKQIQLNLRRNDQIVSSAFKIWKHDVKVKTKRPLQLNVSDSCYYYHKDHISSAVIDFCQEYGWEGFVHLEDNTLEIRPSRNDFTFFTLSDDSCVKKESNISFGKPHIIKRSLQLIDNSSFYDMDHSKRKQRHVQNTQRKLTIVLAVFFDEAAYHTFMPFLENEGMLRLMILAYVNNIQAVFHHPSLGVSIDILLVHLEIMKKQPLELPTFDDSDKLLQSFCQYAMTRNSLDNTDPGHWNVGLYLTGKNIISKEAGTIIGLSYVNRSCDPNWSCVLVKFGVAHSVSSGFTSSITAAHEIGHLLGMEHDSKSSELYKYIMSRRRTYYGQTTWSKSSRNKSEEIWNTKRCFRDHTRSENLDDDLFFFDDLPGREWTAKAQCEIFFRNKDANVVSMHDICKTLQCETPHQNGFYLAGPALEGTYCAHGKECRGGECMPIIEPPYIFKYCKEDNWSEWKTDSCKSDCLEKSKGVIVKRRSCQHGSYRTSNCQGPYYDVVLCDDSLYCDKHKSRQTIFNFTAIKCQLFRTEAIRRKLLFEVLEPERQALHNVKKPWIACSISCQRKDMHNYSEQRVEMLEIGIDPYFPDGTWCHYEDGQDYYCRQHYCLPKSYS